MQGSTQAPLGLGARATISTALIDLMENDAVRARLRRVFEFVPIKPARLLRFSSTPPPPPQLVLSARLDRPAPSDDAPSTDSFLAISLPPPSFPDLFLHTFSKSSLQHATAAWPREQCPSSLVQSCSDETAAMLEARLEQASILKKVKKPFTFTLSLSPSRLTDSSTSRSARSH